MDSASQEVKARSKRLSPTNASFSINLREAMEDSINATRDESLKK